MARLTGARVVLAGAVAVLAAGCSGPPQPTAVEVTRGACGSGWAQPHGGDQTIQIHNVGTVTMDVAKAVSDAKTPANFFVRVRRRF